MSVLVKRQSQICTGIERIYTDMKLRLVLKEVIIVLWN